MFVPKPATSSSFSSSSAVTSTGGASQSIPVPASTPADVINSIHDNNNSSTREQRKQKEQQITQYLLRKFLYFYPFLLYEKDYQFMISEVQCNDPSCVPIETLIVIILNDSALIQEYFEKPSHSSQKILKPILEVTDLDLEESIDFQPFSLKNKSFYHSFLSIRSTIVQNIVKEESETNEMNPEKQLFFQQMMKNYNNTSHLQSVIQENALQVQILEKERKKQADEERKRKIQEANEDVTIVKMKSSSTSSTTIIKQSLPAPPPPVIPTVSEPKLIIVNNSNALEQKPRHEKDRKRSGCPCCDPDNLDNKIDRMMFLDIPPN